MAFEIDTLLSCKFTANIKSGGSTVIDEQPTKMKTIIFTKQDADKIFSEYSTQQNSDYTNAFHRNINSGGDRFIFNLYSAGGYYDGSAIVPKSKEISLKRNFNTSAFKNFLLNSDSFKNFVYESNFFKGKKEKEKRPAINQNFLNKISTKEIDSTNKVSFFLDYEIPKMGWAEEKFRGSNKEKIKQRIGFGQTTFPGDFKRIVKIMSFILARERGTVPEGLTGNGSEELMHREYGLICWSIINTCASGFQKSGNNLLNVLKNKNYVNTDEFVGQNDENSDNTDKMNNKYQSNNKTTQNLEYFVLAFFAGWVHEEFQGVTNWSHLNGLTAYRSFHLPKNDTFEDPDIGQDISIEIFYEDNSLGNFNVKLDSANSTPATSLDSTKTLDGDVIFTKSVLS